jgi:hypothetical protein
MYPNYQHFCIWACGIFSIFLYGFNIFSLIDDSDILGTLHRNLYTEADKAIGFTLEQNAPQCCAYCIQLREFENGLSIQEI